MTTIKELLLQIPEHGEAAVRNCLNEDNEDSKGIDRLEWKCPSISVALAQGFSWIDTPEKDGFWREIWKEYGGDIKDFFLRLK